MLLCLWNTDFCLWIYTTRTRQSVCPQDKFVLSYNPNEFPQIDSRRSVFDADTNGVFHICYPTYGFLTHFHNICCIKIPNKKEKPSFNRFSFLRTKQPIVNLLLQHQCDMKKYINPHDMKKVTGKTRVRPLK